MVPFFAREETPERQIKPPFSVPGAKWWQTTPVDLPAIFGRAFIFLQASAGGY